MNKVILIGRLVADPDVMFGGSNHDIRIAKYTLAVDRPYKRDAERETDFIRCATFGKGAEFTEKYLKKGMKMAVTGRIQTGSYVNKEGQKVYTTEVIVDEQEFAESKKDSGATTQSVPKKPSNDTSFINVPDDEDSDLPFN